MIIETIKPSAPLDRFVNCFWTLEKLTRNHTELVYPTGRMQLLFHYGSPFTSSDPSGVSTMQNSFTIFGQQISYSTVTAGISSGTVAAVLHPHSERQSVCCGYIKNSGHRGGHC